MQEAASHTDPRTTARHDRDRTWPDRHATCDEVPRLHQDPVAVAL
jgi:hypothetical protein